VVKDLKALISELDPKLIDKIGKNITETTGFDLKCSHDDECYACILKNKLEQTHMNNMALLMAGMVFGFTPQHFFINGFIYAIKYLEALEFEELLKK
jgi:hypothetical protein